MNDDRSRRPFTIRFNKKCNDQGEIEISLNPPFKPRSSEAGYVISLTTFSAINLIANLHSENNKFYYNDKTLTLPIGFYLVKEYNEQIKSMIKANKGDPDAVNINVNDSTGLVSIDISKGYKVYFNKENTFRECLGFDAIDFIADGSYTGTKLASLQTTSHVYIGCSACRGNLYINDGQCEESDIIYSFPANFRYGSPISFQLDPKLTESVLNHNGVLNKITMKFFDDKKRPVTFGGSRVGISLRVRMD